MSLMLFNFYRVIRSWRKGRDFFAKLEYKQDGIPSCRGCGHGGGVFYDHYYRKAKVASIDGRIYDVIIKARRYRCPKCGRIYREPIRGLKSNKRLSEKAKDEIIGKYLDGATNKKISKRLRVSDTALVVIDRFECHPKFYARKSTKCELSSGKILDCFVYFANGGRPSEEKSKLLKNY